MITSGQIKAARALIGWSGTVLANKSGIGFSTLMRLESIEGVPSIQLKTLEAIKHRPAFGLNFDPSHFIWQDLDPVGFLWDFKDRIYHVDCKESKKQLNGRNGRMGSHLPWADQRRGWDFVSVGHGDVPWEACFRMLNAIGYDGPISIEWEDAGMDRLIGGPESLDFIRKMVAIEPPKAAFDAAFSSKD